MYIFVPLALLALLFVLGPLLALRPRPRERQLARLRAAAAENGLRVRRGDGEGQVDPAGERTFYLLEWLPQQRKRLPQPLPGGLRRSREGWLVQREDAAVSSADPGAELATLAPGITQLGFSIEGVFAVWDERGEAADVARLAQLLRRFRDAVPLLPEQPQSSPDFSRET